MTQRLVGMVAHAWPRFDGELASRGLDPLEMPIDRFLNLSYWWGVHGATEQTDIDRFDRKLWMPPKGVTPAAGSPWSPEAETAAFGALASVFGTAKTRAPE